MGLETGTYISDLVTTNPLGSDNKSQGDDHIRLIKQVIKNTFPNITGPVNLTQTQINNLLNAGNEEFIENGSFIPSGVIVMWSGSIASIPTGWYLCNGLNGTPNLEDRFIVGAVAETGGLGGVNATGGTNSNHNHTITVAGTSLTEAQLPAHHHLLLSDSDEGISNEVDQASDYIARIGTSGTSSKYILAAESAVGASATVGRSSSTGSGSAHTHTATNTSASHLPAYYQLAFIMKG